MQVPTPAVAQLLGDLADNQRSADHPKLTANFRHAYPKLGLAQRRGLLLHCATALGPDGHAARAAVRAFTEADEAAKSTAPVDFDSDSPSSSAPSVPVMAVMQLRAALAPRHETLFTALAREVREIVVEHIWQDLICSIHHVWFAGRFELVASIAMRLAPLHGQLATR